MAFRAEEAAQLGYEEMEKYFVPRTLGAGDAVRARSKAALREIVLGVGPAITRYPTWHPLVRLRERSQNRHSTSVPSSACGYEGLDHTQYFVNGFITCPYGDGQEVLDSVKALPRHHAAHISARKLDFPLYNDRTTPIFVHCEWMKPLAIDNTIPLSLAAPLLLETELPCLAWSEVGETWEAMRSDFLGGPHGARSSLFVSQETGQGLKKLWNAIIDTGMFGPIMKGVPYGALLNSSASQHH